MSTDVWAVDDDATARSSRFRLPARRPLRYAVLAVLGLVAVLILLAVVVAALYVRPGSHGVSAAGRNMEPAIEPGDHLLSVPDPHPRPGDIVVYRRTGEFSLTKEYLARVVATGGQIISCPAERGKSTCESVRLDGNPIDEHGYLSLDGTQGQQPFPPITVPPGSVFLLGDHRNDSLDSRLLGPIHESDVVGKARLRYWPLGRSGSVR